MFTASAQTKTDDIVGKWEAEDGSAQFEIYKSGNEYRGKIIWLKNHNGGEAKDKKNPDENLRDRPILGLDILTDLSYSPSTKTWSGGSLYSPEKGMYANCSVVIIRDKEIKIIAQIKGFTRSKIWKRL
jgi:uncharacterized protein (DUF2147 family)